MLFETGHIKMRLVLLTHPASMASESMPRFANMIWRDMRARGYEVEIWTSPTMLGGFPIRSAFIRKWLGYADQFLIYPLKLKTLVSQKPKNTLFVVTDQALGMWVPYLVKRPHVIHCHDFLALRSALGEFSENKTGWTGQQYQSLIRKGFSQGKAFISVSQKTKDDLQRFLPAPPPISEVVHNGLNHPFRPMEHTESIDLLKHAGIETPRRGFILHIGGNLWYKNRLGVLKIYQSYATSHSDPLPLWMIGPPPTVEMLSVVNSTPKGKVHFLSNMTNEQVNAAYAQAGALLFPSLEEGFGWPVAEAMTVGCPVITTNKSPLTEVAGHNARLIPRMPTDKTEQADWVKTSAAILSQVVDLDNLSREQMISQGKLNAGRFNSEAALAAYEHIYQKAFSL